MIGATYYTIFILSAIFTCKAQLLLGGVPIINGAHIGQPITLNYHNPLNTNAGIVGAAQQFVARGIPAVPSLGHSLVPNLRLHTSPTVGILPVGISPLQLRSIDAKENANGQSGVYGSPLTDQTKIVTQQLNGQSIDSIDPVDQQTDEIPKEVIGSSGSFSDGTRGPVPPKTRSPESGDGLPDLDYLSKAADPEDSLEKKIEKTAVKIGKGITHAFKSIPKLFQGRAEERHNEESAPSNNYQHEGGDIKQPTMSAGLKKAMDEFQKRVSNSQLMQKFYGDEKSDSKQHYSDVSSHGTEAGATGNFWDSAASAAKNVADTLIKEGQTKMESGTSSGSTQETNPMSKFLNSANNAADNFAGYFKNSANSDYNVPTADQKGVPPNFWKAVSEYVDKHAKNYANTEQPAKNQFVGGPYEEDYGYNHGGYSGYYGNGNHGHQDHHEHHGHHDHHGHDNHGHHSQYYPYYPGYYQNGYYPTNGWQYGGDYFKRSPVELDNSAISKNSVDLPESTDGTDESSVLVAESVLDLIRSIMDGKPKEIAHASINMGTEIADSATDSDVYKRTAKEKAENATSTRSMRQMPSPQLMQPAGDITNSALLLAQSIIAGKPDQIANAGVHMGSGIAGTVNSGPRFFKRSDSLAVEDSSSVRNPRQMLPNFGGLMSPVSTGIASTALNFAQGYVRAHPSQGIVQPIAGGFGTAAGNLVGLVQNPTNLAQGVPLNQFGQIAGSALNIAQGVMSNSPGQIANAGVNMGTSLLGAANQAPRYFKRSDSAVSANPETPRILRQIPFLTQGWAQPDGSITNSALNLAHGILSGNPAQIANSGVNMGSSIGRTGLPTTNQGLPVNQFGPITGSALNMAQGIMSNNPEQIANAGINLGSGIATPRFFKRSESASQNATASRILRQIPVLYQGQRPSAESITNSALNLAQSILNGNPAQIAHSGIIMGSGIAETPYESPVIELPVNQFGQISDSAMNVAQGILNGPNQILHVPVNAPSSTSRFFKRSDTTEPQARILRQLPAFTQGWAQPAGSITNSALGLAQSILSGDPSQIANSGINVGTSIGRTGFASPSQQLPVNQFGQITGTALNLAQGITSNNPDQIANAGINLGSGIATPRFFKRSVLTDSQKASLTRSLRQIPGWDQPADSITNSALGLAQSILSGNPAEIANSGVNMGTGIAGTATGNVFNGPRFFKRSPQDGIWRSATGLAGTIANSANVDPSTLKTQELMGKAGTIWKAANNLFGNLGKSVITPINSDRLVGASKEGEKALPSDLIWESISDLAGNIAKVTEKPTILGKTLALSNCPDKSVIQSPNILSNTGTSQILEATKPSGEIAHSATALASRIASLLMNPNVFDNPNLDAKDFKPANVVLNPIYMAGDIVSAALNPEAYRNVRMLKTYAPTHTGSYVKMNIPVISADSQ